MTQQEFTERTGLLPTQEEYSEIDAMYMAARNMEKDEFCRTWRQCGKNPLTKALFKQTQILNGMLEERTNELNDCHEKMNDLVDMLIRKATAYNDSNLYNAAVKLAGHKNVAIRKIEMNLPLWDEDMNYIRENLK